MEAKPLAGALPTLRRNENPTTQLSSLPAVSVTKWLETWAAQPFHERADIPATYRGAIEGEVGAARALLTPATAEARAVALRKLLDFCRAFGMNVPEDSKPLLAIWAEHLSDIPGDLLLTAVSRTTGGWKYQTPPKPADLRASVERDLVARRKRLHLAQTALLKAK